jgi:hypothetical protein
MRQDIHAGTLRRGLAGLLLLLASVHRDRATQTQQVYRYLDTDGPRVSSGRTSRQPADARNAQAKRIGRNSIETSELSFATQQAQERFRSFVHFSCGVVCDTAQEPS